MRSANRLLIGASLAATGLLAEVAAQAFPGHARAVVGRVPAAPAAALTQPASTQPASTQPASTQPASTVAAAQPPVVSGGS